MSIVMPASAEYRVEFYRRAGDGRKIYNGVRRGVIDFEEAINWIIERDLQLVIKADGNTSIFSEPMQVNTTPPVPPTRDAAIICLKKKCISGELGLVSFPDAEDKYVEFTTEDLKKSGDECLRYLSFLADKLFDIFPIWEHLIQQVSSDDEWLSTEEAVTEVMRGRSEARSREGASLWLLEAAARGELVVKDAGVALAYRAAGYAGIWKSICFQRGPLWSLSSLEAKLSGAGKKRPDNKRGRRPKDIWPTIYVEATKYVALESSIAEPMVQADLERWIAQRLNAHGETAADSTIREKASFVLRVFGEAGR